MFFPSTAPPALQALRALWAEHMAILVAALIITLLLTPVCRGVAIRLKVYDMPDRRLKPHGKPIPYLGGLAMCLGIAVPLVLAMHFDSVADSTARALWGVLIAAVLITITGLVDDLVSVKPIVKIAAQVLAALILAYSGVVFRAVPGGIGEVRWLPAGSPVLVGIGVVIQVALMVAACNATNLLDGLDGLCSGVTAIIAVGFLLMATSLSGWSLWGQAPDYQFAPVIILISMALLGAALGFLPYNFNPASIFMGDAGSMLMGFVCATLITMFAEQPGLLKWVIGALAIFGLPLFDTSLAFTRRWLNGRPIFLGDRSHFYDQLVDRGLSVRQAVLACYTLALAFVLLGVGIIFIRTRYGILIYLLTCIVLAIVVIKAGMLRVDRLGETPPAKPVEDAKAS